MPEPAKPAPAPRFEHYTLSSTEMFTFDSAELGQSQSKLDEIAAALNKDTSVDNVVISGYTDRLGSNKYNDKLSLRRAEAVKAYLANKGVNPGRMTAVGKGEANPLVECKQTKRAALITCLEPNRRVEVEQISVKRRVN
jgi:OOP family OmpA-OmpF porin